MDITLDQLRHLPFARLFERRILFLRGPIVEGAADELVAQLLALEADADDPITLVIDSPGGDAMGLFAVYDTMEMIDAPVHTRCVGLAASAAAVILAGGTGVRSATPNSRILIHQPHGAVGGGQAVDIQIQAQEFAFLRRRQEEILAERTGQPIEKIRADTDRDFWLSAEAAKAYGIIDDVTPPGRHRPLRAVDSG